MTTRPFGGVVLTDWTLLASELAVDEKIVAGLMLDPRKRNDSLEQLVAKGPYNRQRTREARRSLHYKGYITTRVGGGYANSRHVLHVDPRMETRDHGANRSQLLHGDLIHRLLAGSHRGGDRTILLAALYLREQIRRGAIMVSEPVAADLIDISRREVQGAKRRLLDTGVIVQVSTHLGRPVYVMPQAKPPPDFDRFDPWGEYDILGPTSEDEGGVSEMRAWVRVEAEVTALNLGNLDPNWAAPDHIPF